jgi:hypothetical protein
MPFAFASPICNTAKAFTMLAEKHMYAAQQSSSALVSDDSDAENECSITFNLPSSLVDTFTWLVSTINHPLFADQPVTSNVPPPEYNPFILSPVKKCTDLLQFEPQTECKSLLQVALRNSALCEAYLFFFLTS